MGHVEVRITATVVSSRYGNMGAGDILRTDPAYARHLVDDCKVARYVNQTTPQPITRRTRRPKEIKS